MCCRFITTRLAQIWISDYNLLTSQTTAVAAIAFSLKTRIYGCGSYAKRPIDFSETDCT